MIPADCHRRIFPIRKTCCVLFVCGLLLSEERARAQFTVYNSGATTTIETGLNVYVLGSFTNQTQAATPGTMDNQGSVFVRDNWTNNSANGVFTTAAGLVTLNGSTAAQTIGGSNSTDFYNLTMTNTFGTSPQYILGINTTTRNTLTMTSGNTNLAGFQFTIGTAAATPGSLSYTAGWMYGGNLRRYFNTPTVAMGAAAGHFPVGASADYRPFWLAFGSALTTGGTITLNHTGVYPANSNSVSFLDASWGYTVIYNTESYWTVSTSGVAVGGAPFDIRLEGTGLGNINMVSDLDLCLIGSVVGTHAASAGTIVNPQVNRTALTLSELDNAGGSQNFRMGSRSSNSPLPVKLLNFDAVLNGDKVDLTWTTATEQNNDYFLVERSSDGISFEKIKQVKGAGNSIEIRKYETVDEFPLTGISFYRLKQVDFDGKFSYSNLVAVNISKHSAITLFPNPVQPGQTPFLNIPEQSESKEVLVVVNDVNGKELYSKIIITESTGETLVAVDPYGNLSAGIYFITATSDDRIFRQKLVVR